jgi:hypothetical protein
MWERSGVCYALQLLKLVAAKNNWRHWTTKRHGMTSKLPLL